MGETPVKKEKRAFPPPHPPPRGCVQTNRHLLATLGSEGVDLVGTEFLKISAMNAIVPITPSPTGEVCSFWLAPPPAQ